MADAGAKFISRNRSPRVQIEYDLETLGSRRKVRLPFVVGVISDLSGTPTEDNTPAPVTKRDFVEIDAFNFNNRLSKIRPRAKFRVTNLITGKDSLEVDLTFQSMDDFSPDKVAEKVDALRGLLDARKKLEGLKVFLDGKSGAEDLIQKALANDAVLQGLITAAGAAEQSGLTETGQSTAPAQE
jgi:type VI secretion system protein ImpB